MDKMGFRGIGIFLLLAAAAIFPAQAALTITTASVPPATIGVPYSVQLQDSGADGETVTWEVYIPTESAPNPQQGFPPPGLSLSEDGLISGTPTTAGTYPFQVVAGDQMSSAGPQQFSITVSACVPTMAPASLTGADVNTLYSVTFSISGCPDAAGYTFSAQSATPFGNEAPLPAGLSLASNGILSGTPTQVSPAGSPYTFFITASGPNQSSTQVQYSLAVNPLPTIATPSPLPSALVGVLYSQQITATGGVPNPTTADPSGYRFLASGVLPPGITFSANGLFSGTPTQTGTFQFNLGVTDSLGAQAPAVPFQVTFDNGVPLLQVSPLSLTFNADLQGNPPLTQAISVTPSSGAAPPLNFSVLIDQGQSNASPPGWITVTPTSGAAPAGLIVSVQPGTLAAGAYQARILVLDSNKLPTDVSVTLNVNNAPQQLTVSPSILRFSALAAFPGNLVEDLVVSNAGAVPLAFTASAVGGSSWISSISSGSGQTALDAPVFVQVQVNTSGLQVGSYHDIIQLASAAGNVDIPISLFIAESGPLLAVNTTGVLFQARQNGGSSVTSNIEILDIGDRSSTVNWTASLVSGSDWLDLISSSGSATPAAPGLLSLAPVQNATQMAPGPYYALVKIADPNSLNSPQYVSAVLNLEADSAAPSPEVSPTGLFFSATAGGSAPSPQQVLINTSSASAVPFQVSVTTTNGSWLSATPASGNASAQSPGNLSVSANPTGLAAGIYTGNVSVSISQVLQSVNVTLVVLPASAANASRGPRPEVVNCTASKLAITETGLANNFSVPAGWPATLIVQLDDDCGSLVLDGNVSANFSNGDPALALVGDSLGNYSATWAPSAVTPEMVVTLNAAAGTLQPATATLYGGIGQNQTPPPTLSPGGTLNNLNPLVGGALAPGTIAQVYGSGLAASPVSTGMLPLPTIFDKTFAQVGAYRAPLYFLSSGQLNVQLPSELTASQQIPILLSVNNALTLPITLDIVPTAPGVLSDFKGPTPPSTQNGANIIAQHANFSLVSSSSPANPGEYLVMYLVGLGATTPSVASGVPAPSSTLAKVTHPVTVTVDSLPSTVLFAGLTPGFVGLYQINFQVPSGAHSGNVVVTVTQNGIAANPTLLPVSP
jgi:uncharacterized protein (TIGR03437 family)